jgi:hypothetical protein
VRRSVFAVSALLAVTAVTAVTAGCSHSSGAGNDAANAAAAGGGVGNNRAPSAAPLRAGAQAAGVPHSAGTAAAVAKLSQQQEIRTADITVAIKGADRVAQQADAAVAIAARAGGEVTQDDRISGKHASATMVLRVPPRQLEPTLQALAKLGTEKSRQLSTVDVTSRIADITSRVASAQAAIARLRTLYRQATKIRDLIAVETQLSSREAALESLEARARVLANQVALATITLRLLPAVPHKHKPKPVPVKHYSGFVGGLERGWHAFSTAVAWLAVAFGALLPFLLTALVLAAGTWAWRRRTRHAPSADPSG